jgi:hypothetical protein
MGLFTLSPPPMIILGDALLTAPPPKPMEHMVAVRKWFDQGGDEPKPTAKVSQGDCDWNESVWKR